MSVLAHLVTSMGRGEPEATQALAYILGQQPGIVRAFVSLLGTAGVTFNPGRIECERGHDGGRPDLKIYHAEGGADGNPSIMVENKFWAGLTDAQPVGYLDTLPDVVGSALVFIVPRKRVDTIWKELKRRCQEDLVLGNEDALGRIRWVQVSRPPRETKTMLVTDWQNILDTLEGAADGHEIQCDILQLRRLVEKLENLQAFPALRSDEVTNVDVARRIINYIELIDLICSRLGTAGIKSGSAAGNFNYPSFSRSLTYRSEEGQQIVVWLALLFPVWRRSGGITPLWLWVDRDSCRNFDELENLFEEVDVSGSGNDKYIPIRLKLGVERERVVEDAVEQICDALPMLT